MIVIFDDYNNMIKMSKCQGGKRNDDNKSRLQPTRHIVIKIGNYYYVKNLQWFM